MGSAEASRVEYKYSRDYKVTLFCFLLPISCDRRQKEAYYWVMHCKLCVCVCVCVCAPMAINKIFKVSSQASSCPLCPVPGCIPLISQSVYPAKQRDNKWTLMPSFFSLFHTNLSTHALPSVYCSSMGNGSLASVLNLISLIKISDKTP